MLCYHSSCSSDYRLKKNDKEVWNVKSLGIKGTFTVENRVFVRLFQTPPSHFPINLYIKELLAAASWGADLGHACFSEDLLINYGLSQPPRWLAYGCLKGRAWRRKRGIISCGDQGL